MKAILIGLAGAALAAIGAYFAGDIHGQTVGYDKRVAEQAAADARANLERKGDNAKLKSLSQYDLCVAGLSGNGMPVDACEQLRGL